MIKTRFVASVLFLALFLCNSIVAQKSFIGPKLQKIWTSQEGLNVPSQNLLLVPTFNDHKVNAYKLKL